MTFSWLLEQLTDLNLDFPILDPTRENIQIILLSRGTLWRNAPKRRSRKFFLKRTQVGTFFLLAFV
jgi:hypothetical protein